MAKTIYEMAVAYATEDGENGKPIIIKCEKDAFIFGANAVLEEIEAIIEPIIESTDEGILDEDDRYYDENITAIYNKIKELKGEKL